MPRNIIHVVGTGTIGEPLIGILSDFKTEFISLLSRYCLP